jgi:hypothetical protein
LTANAFLICSETWVSDNESRPSSTKGAPAFASAISMPEMSSNKARRRKTMSGLRSAVEVTGAALMVRSGIDGEEGAAARAAAA